MSPRNENGAWAENHRRAAELHDLAAHAHRSAAAQQGKHDHQSGSERSTQSLEHSRQAHLQTQEMHRKANGGGIALSPERASHLKGLPIHASDGEIGSIEEFYFDDETWVIRYMVVNTGSWLSGRLVLISPIFLHRGAWDGKQLHLTLTKKQIENSPAIDTHKPVSRQHEAQYFDYFGSPYYWVGPWLWGPGSFPGSSPGDVAGVESPGSADGALSVPEIRDSHLRSSAAVTGYRVEAADGEIGHVADFIVDMYTWSIRYLEVETRNWIVGRKVLLSPEWIQTVSWGGSKVVTRLPIQTIRGAPEFIGSKPITPEYENQLLEYYGWPPDGVRIHPLPGWPNTVV